jgi:biopolymer transport protein TolR
MAFGRSITASGPASGGGRSTGAGGQRPLSDINVTPLVDVMLVLVVIFIVTAPLMASAIRVDLPRADAGRAASGIQPSRPARLSVDARGALFLDDQPVDETTLAARLTALATAAPDIEIQLRADRTVPYGRIVELMALAGRAGLVRIGFVADTPAPSAPSR